MAHLSTAPASSKERARLIHARLVAQSLIHPAFERPEHAIAAFGAMQGQDLPGVMSSLALRLTPPAPGMADARIAAVVDDFNNGSVVRGYPMRGTVFALAGADARWITELAAKPKEWEAPRRRDGLGLNPEMVERARGIALSALSEHPRGLSRTVLFEKWRDRGISPDGGRGYHLSKYFIASGLLIYGPFNGKDNDVVLAEGWLPKGSSLEERFNGDRVAATAHLLTLYIMSHGPATLRDFAWWTKLPLREIRSARAHAGDALSVWGMDVVGEELLARPGLESEVEACAARLNDVHLLPGFDELVLGYQDRLALLGEDDHRLLAPGNNGVFMKSIVRRGQIVGTWRAPMKGGVRTLNTKPFAPLPAAARKELAKVCARFPHA